MATSKSTTNYKLPIYAPDDVTSWLVTWNGAMTELDDIIANVQKLAEAAGTDVTLVEQSVETLKTTVRQLNTTVTGNSSDINNLKVKVADIDGEVTNLTAEVEEATRLVGVSYSGVLGVGEDTLTIAAPAIKANSSIQVFTDAIDGEYTGITTNLVDKIVTLKFLRRDTTMNVKIIVREE